MTKRSAFYYWHDYKKEKFNKNYSIDWEFISIYFKIESYNDIGKYFTIHLGLIGFHWEWTLKYD